MRSARMESKMNCKKWNTIINEYIDNLLTADQKTAFELHLANCSDCSRQVQEFMEVGSMVKTLSQLDLPDDFEVKLRRAIVADELNRTTKDKKRTNFSGMIKWAGAAAAIFLILFGVLTDRFSFNIFETEPQQEQQAMFMEAAPVQEEAVSEKVQNDANLVPPSEVPTPAAVTVENEKDQIREARLYTAKISRIETNSIDLNVKSVIVTVDTLRDIAYEHGIEVLDFSCQGITLSVTEELREILYTELSRLGRIVETGDQYGTDAISIMILYGID